MQKKSFLLFSAFLLISGHSSAKTLLPTNVTVITREELLDKPYVTVSDALVNVTSIKMERDGYLGSRAVAKMRGLSSAKDVLVMIDGRPLTHEYDSQVDLSQIPLSMIDRIEITRGGSSVSYSNEAVAGSINVVTNRPINKGLRADLGTGIGRYGLKHSEGQITARSNIGDITYDASNAYANGFLFNEDFQTTNHFGNFTRSFNGKGYWGAEYTYHDSRIGTPDGTSVPFDEWNGHLEREPYNHFAERTQEFQQAKAFLASPKFMGGNAYATFTKSLRDMDERETRGGIALRDQDSDVQTMDVSWKSGIIETGAQAKEYKRAIYPFSSNTVYQNDFYLLGKFSGDRYSLIPGGRFSHHSRSGDFFAPRVAGLFSPTDQWLFSATFQNAQRVPNFDELFVSSAIINNTNLNEEKSTSYDAGVAFTPSKHWTFKSTAFWTNVKDLITENPVSSQLENDGEEKANGVESEILIREKRTDVTASWTVQKSERSLPSTNGYVQSAMTPKNLIRVNVSQKLTRALAISSEVRWQSEQFQFDNRQGLRIPGFYVWNARFTARILAATMFFQAENMTGRRYAETAGTFLYPQAKQNYQAGVTIRFIN